MMNDYDQNNQNLNGQEQPQVSGSDYYTSGEGQTPPVSNVRFGADTYPAGQEQPKNPVEPQTDSTYHYRYYGEQNGPQNGYDGHRAETEIYHPAQPFTPPVPPTAPEKKKSGKGGIIAAALICLILGLGIGGGAVWLVSRDNDVEKTDPPVEVEQSTMEVGSEDENTAFHSTTIEVTTNATSTSMTPQSVYEHYVNAVVAISNEGTSTNIFGQVSATASSGSGMIISKDGYILTNNHVVEGAEKLTVTMTSGEEYEATIVGTDSDNDVALIKIEGEDFPTVSIGDSDSIEVGEQLCAIGNPLGELTNTLTVGYVSALDREINENGIPINMFQTDCAINAGNSGGPIFDMNGNVVGVTTAKYSASASSSSASIEGIGFCIPINDAMDIVDDLLQYGYVRGRVSMGIMCQAISSTVTQYYNLPAGIYVSSVEEGSAAELAGMAQGDIICAIDGVSVTSVTDLKVKLKEYKPGETATLTVYRNETRATEDMTITFDEMVATTNDDTTEPEEETEVQQNQQNQQNQSVNPFFPFG